MSAFGERSNSICVSLWSMSFWVRSCCVSDVMCSVCCVSQQNSCSCIEPLGTCVYVHTFVLSYICLCVCVRGPAALYHCHSLRQRKTLMLFYTDTYLTPLSLTLTLLQADIRVIVCRTVISHQTMAPKLWPKAHSAHPQSFFSSLVFAYQDLWTVEDSWVDTSGFIPFGCWLNVFKLGIKNICFSLSSSQNWFI